MTRPGPIPANGALPPVNSGPRRRLLAMLVGVGVAQAGLTVLVAVLTPRLLAGSGAGVPVSLVLVLLASAGLVGLGRVAERVLAEDLGQHYVAEVRRLLVASALSPERGANIGITVARTTNDLSALKNWVSLGISPLAVGIPLVGGVVLGLLVVMPVMGAVVAATLLVFGAVVALLLRPALTRARRLRKVRGRMAAHIADTVSAGGSIRVAGGVRRELRHIDRLSSRVSEAAHERAAVSGAIRGAAASLTAVLGVLVVLAGVWSGTPTATVTVAIMVAGMLAAPINDLGRVSEYRQNQQAAALVLAPVIAAARRYQAGERRRAREQAGTRLMGDHPGLSSGAVHVTGLGDRFGSIPSLVASPGSRVLVVAESQHRLSHVMGHLTGDLQDALAWVEVAGRQIGDLPATDRRALVGFASRSTPVERGSIARVVRYRVPESSTAPAEHLARVGLDGVVAALPDGERTRLRRGGEPLTHDQRARLKLARAIADDPPLLVLDRLDDQLDAPGRLMLREVLADYPGCVLLRSSDPTSLLDVYDVWNLDDLDDNVVVARPVERARAMPRPSTWLAGGELPPLGRAPRRSAAALDLDEEPAASQTPGDELEEEE